VGPRAVLDVVVKRRKIPSLYWESNTRTLIVQPTAHIKSLVMMKTSTLFP
jgi:hypothetical protein